MQREPYGTEDVFGTSVKISKQELNGVLSLMKGINPIDTLETLYAAQIVVSHLLGMRKLSNNYSSEQKVGLDLLRFSNEAMAALTRKRCGGHQNITVNYNQAKQFSMPKGNRCRSKGLSHAAQSAGQRVAPQSARSQA